MTSAEIAAGLSPDPEDEIVQVELDEAQEAPPRARADHRHRRLRRRHRRRLRVRPAPDRGLRRRLGRRADAVLGMDRRARRSRVSSTSRPTGRRSLPRSRALVLRATRVTLASSALSSVAPGGAAVGMATSFAMLRAWGFRAAGRARRCRAERLEPVRDPRLPDPRRRRPRR